MAAAPSHQKKLAAAIAVLISLSSHSLAITHKIKSGDTLWTLAKKYHTTPRQIAKANGIRETAVLSIGKKLYIPVPGAAKTSDKTRNASANRSASSKASKFSMLVVTKDNVCIRSGPGTGHKKVAVVVQGTKVKRLYRTGSWLKVALEDGRCGYVYRPLVDIARSSGRQVAPATGMEVASSDKSNIVQTALAYRGTRYRRGGTSRGGFDCSGFTRHVFAKYGISLPHSSAAQARIGRPVSRDELQPGDLVFFQTYRRGISHVGIYIGNGQFVHASTHRRGVTVDSLNSPYYASRYRGARRVR
ncbi:MAG: NlpC/P60 family protein [Armatimonadota bacterium]|nr:NlpC/P60 family protein [Armatimonadota bacterium]